MKFINVKNLYEAKQALDILLKLDNYYPEFISWYWNKVVPDTLLNSGEIILLEKDNNIIGVSIIKDSINEQKLRCLRIKEEYQNKGYGLFLMDESLKRLNNDKPLLSVSEDMFSSFARMFINKYNFNMTFVHKNLYKKGKLEYQFNGNVDSLKISNYEISLIEKFDYENMNSIFKKINIKGNVDE